MIYILSCVWLDYMVKYFQCKNCVGSSPKTKKCVASFLVPEDTNRSAALRGTPVCRKGDRVRGSSPQIPRGNCRSAGRRQQHTQAWQTAFVQSSSLPIRCL